MNGNALIVAGKRTSDVFTDFNRVKAQRYFIDKNTEKLSPFKICLGYPGLQTTEAPELKLDRI